MSACPSIGGTEFERALHLYRAKEYESSCQILQDLVEKEPANAESRHLFALVLRGLHRLQEAAENLAEVLRLQPQDCQAWSNYGAILRELGRLDEALEATKCATVGDSQNAFAWNNLGTVQLDLGRPTEAIHSFETALAIDSHCAEAMANLSRSHFELGDMPSAKKAARIAIALDPTLAEAHNRLALIQGTAGELELCIKSLRSAVKASPDNDLYASNLLLRSLGSDSLKAPDLLEQATSWGRKYASVHPLRTRKPKTLQRLGFISGDLRSHPVGYFLKPLLKDLRNQVDVFCYSTGRETDELTESLKGLSSSWRNLYRCNAFQGAELIAEDELDILIDLSGHTRDGRLDVLAHRPAPIQVSWLGFSGTTGLPQMDFMLADKVLVPIGEDTGYTERVLRLPDSFLCFEAPDLADVNLCLEHCADFGVFNNPTKYSNSAYRAWASILQEAPGSTLLFKYHNLHDLWVQEQIIGRICSFGIERSRIRFGSTIDYRSHLATVAGVKVALDTFPYTGATTTLDCLSVGTPIVTLAGDRYASRMTASLLATIGVTETVCNTESTYVETALKLLGDESWNRAAARDALLSSPLCDSARFATGFLTTLRTTLA